MTVKPLVEKLRAALESADIPYFVTGSFASSAPGVPRSTNDIDIVIAPTEHQLTALLAHFPESEFGASPDDALEARRKGSTCPIDAATLWKVFHLSSAHAFRDISMRNLGRTPVSSRDREPRLSALLGRVEKRRFEEAC